MKKIAYLIVNFGGPRNLYEVEPFLKALLNDLDVIRPNLPLLFHRILFTLIAKKRAKKVAEDYEKIGGKSPIFEDTEAIAAQLRYLTGKDIFTFHRYILDTHQDLIKKLRACKADMIKVFPLFPQFTYATTGSCARWMQKHLPRQTINKMHWVKSYPNHPGFVLSQQKIIKEFLENNHLKENETVMIFSAHGVPVEFIDTGDPYQKECEDSFEAVMKGFPLAHSILSFQSQFGKAEWIKPSTQQICDQIKERKNERKHIVFIPISFTSDHIETLFEIEDMYVTPLRDKGLSVWRVPALTLREDWIQSIPKIIEEESTCTTQMLISKQLFGFSRFFQRLNSR